MQYDPEYERGPYGRPPYARTNGMAIAALILSLLWLGGIGSVLGICFGVAAVRKIGRSEGWETGSGMAIAGVILGILGLAGTAVLVILLVSVGKTVVHDIHAIQTGVNTISIPRGSVP